MSQRFSLSIGFKKPRLMSPLLFKIYVADLSLWLKWSIIITYADDTSTSVSGKILKEVLLKLEEDALLVLKFMTSNN